MSVCARHWRIWRPKKTHWTLSLLQNSRCLDETSLATLLLLPGHSRPGFWNWSVFVQNIFTLTSITELHLNSTGGELRRNKELGQALMALSGESCRIGTVPSVGESLISTVPVLVWASLLLALASPHQNLQWGQELRAKSSRRNRTFTVPTIISVAVSSGNSTWIGS